MSAAAAPPGRKARRWRRCSTTTTTGGCARRTATETGSGHPTGRPAPRGVVRPAPFLGLARVGRLEVAGRELPAAGRVDEQRRARRVVLEGEALVRAPAQRAR